MVKSNIKKKGLISVVSIIVGAVVIISEVSLLFSSCSQNNRLEDKIIITNTSFTTSENGPVVNLQSLSSGNFQTIPSEGFAARYGYYHKDEKIGDNTIQNLGRVSYNSYECHKLIGTLSFDLSSIGSSIGVPMDCSFYVRKSNMMPVYMTIEMDYGDSLGGVSGYEGISSEFFWNHDNGKMINIISIMKQKVTITSDLSEDLWNFVSFENLEIGETQSFDYEMTVNVSGASASSNVDMSITLTGIEDTIVAGLEYKDCYVLEMIKQQTTSSCYGSSTIDTDMKIWITGEGIVPKAENTIPILGSSVSMTVLLEEYKQY